MSDGRRVKICKDIGCDREKNRITDVALSQKYGYFLVGTTMGNLNLWKLGFQSDANKVASTTKNNGDDENALNAVRPTHVHQFEGHCQAICGMHFTSVGSCFVSASLDRTIRIWSLLTFTQHYSFDIGLICSKVWLPDPMHYVVHNEHALQLKVGELSTDFGLYSKS